MDLCTFNLLKCTLAWSFYTKVVFIAPEFHTAKIKFTREGQGKKTLSILEFSVYFVIRSLVPFSSRPIYSMVFFFATCLPPKALLAFHIPCLVQLHMGFGFLNLVLVCMEAVSVFLPSNLALFLAFACFLFASLHMLIFSMLGCPIARKESMGWRQLKPFVSFKVHFGFVVLILYVRLSHINISPILV